MTSKSTGLSSGLTSGLIADSAAMPIPPGSRVYIDTNVWVYYSISTTHREARRCERLLQQVENGALRGLVSSFVISEYTDVVRKLLAKQRGTEPTPAETATIRSSLQAHLARLGVEIRDSDELVEEVSAYPPLFKRADELIVAARLTRIMRREGEEWKSLNGADSIHLGLAERAGANFFATCDGGFKGITSPVAPAILREIYP